MADENAHQGPMIDKGISVPNSSGGDDSRLQGSTSMKPIAGTGAPDQRACEHQHGAEPDHSRSAQQAFRPHTRNRAAREGGRRQKAWLANERQSSARSRCGSRGRAAMASTRVRNQPA